MAPAAAGVAPQAQLAAALQLHQSGRLAEAESAYRALLAAMPANAQALHFLGVCRHQQGDFAGALQVLDQALQVDAAQAQIHVSRGNVLRELQQLPAAIDSYGRALQLEPQLDIAQFNLGTALEESGRHAEAIACYDRILARQPNFAAQLGRANSLLALGRAEEAIAAYLAAARSEPDNIDLHVNLGAALFQRQRNEEALVWLERALLLQPGHPGAMRNHALVLQALQQPVGAARFAVAGPGAAVPPGDAWFLRARALASLGRWEDCMTMLERALQQQPDHWGAHFELAAILVTRQERMAEAERHFEWLLARQPDHAGALLNYGMLHFKRGDFSRARPAIERALRIEPHIRMGRFNLGVLDLMEGRMASGWQGHEGRWHGAIAPQHHRDFAQALWLGKESIRGLTLLVHAEQGLGDSLHFCRLLPLLMGRARHVIFEVQAPLVDLLRRALPPAIELVAAGAQLPHFDRHCPLLSLPLALGITLQNIPAADGYLSADPVLRETWRHRIGNRGLPRVGLAWSGHPDQANDRQRSMRLEALRPMLDSELGATGIQWIALQDRVRPADRASLADLPQVQYFGDAIEDFEDTAAIASLCDLVISVDTSAAHLAGALGRPLWVLLSRVACWRWLLDRDDSPWYSTARLFRTTEVGQWSPAVGRVVDELNVWHARWLGNRASTVRQAPGAVPPGPAKDGGETGW